MNILIVGGTGTIGTHLARSLSKQDCRIFLLSRNPKKYHKKFNQNVILYCLKSSAYKGDAKIAIKKNQLIKNSYSCLNIQNLVLFH